MKPLRFIGSSLNDLRNFPDKARRVAGSQLREFNTAWSRPIGSR